MRESIKSKIVGINAVLLSLLFGLVTLNKKIYPSPLRTSTGYRNTDRVFPEFSGRLHNQPFYSLSGTHTQAGDWPHTGLHRIRRIVFIILTVEEFRPMWGASTQFDTWDIVASALGSILGYRRI